MFHLYAFLFSLSVYADFDDIVCRVTAPSGEFMGQYVAGQNHDGSPAFMFQMSSNIDGGRFDDFIAMTRNAELMKEISNKNAMAVDRNVKAYRFVRLDCEKKYYDFPFLYFESTWENFEAQLRLDGKGCEAVCGYHNANIDYRELIIFSGYEMMYQPYPGDVSERIFAGDVPRTYDTKDSYDRNFSTHLRTYVKDHNLRVYPRDYYSY